LFPPRLFSSIFLKFLSGGLSLALSSRRVAIYERRSAPIFLSLPCPVFFNLPLYTFLFPSDRRVCFIRQPSSFVDLSSPSVANPMTPIRPRGFPFFFQCLWIEFWRRLPYTSLPPYPLPRFFLIHTFVLLLLPLSRRSFRFPAPSSQYQTPFFPRPHSSPRRLRWPISSRPGLLPRLLISRGLS